MTWLERIKHMELEAEKIDSTMQQWYYGGRIRVVRVSRGHWQVYDHRYAPPMVEAFYGVNVVEQVATYIELWYEGVAA